MKNNKLPRIIVIIGPTASGKSDLAVKIARRVSGEIISADSRQVYRGMDIGTGKITKKEMRGIPHHLLDVVSPRGEFNVSHFKKLAAKKIEEIVNCGHVPIIVGGTGFWVDALIYDWPIPEVEPNCALRARLGKWPAKRLFARLQKLDPNRAKNIDRHNKRRLIRALEIAVTTGQPVSQFIFKYDRGQKRIEINGKSYAVLILGIKLRQKELERRIYARLIKRLNDGMIQEIKKLHNPPASGGVSWKRLDNFGLEYRYASRYLRGILTYDQMVEKLYGVIKNYAKRQMRWFKRNGQINWLVPDTNTRMNTNDTNKRLYKKVEPLVKKFIA